MTIEDIIADLTRQKQAEADRGHLGIARCLEDEIARLRRLQAEGGTIEDVKCWRVRLSFR